ncbi:folylpolyglutamate synthase [Candidatus Moduliflexus flocculans]|uniref:tetrahydrofolate synthase n=1 Tax=Candidatus Moduliflexus flocculans TaxID=1499966 RepID=A0A081BMR8_9BACT|nr:folylpolyglutamate synthase [Candidatus Moduliflexus flocculans]
MLTLEQYARYKRLELFLDSLIVAKPLPNFVAPAQVAGKPKPFGLERLQSLLQRLGNPQNDLRFVHIAGTSGKTSTTYFTAALLRSQGYRVGMFTSPHVITFAEYFTVDGQFPPVSDLTPLIEEVRPAINAEYEQHEFGVISYFELLVALAFVYFRRRQVDYVVLEAGLGGQHDATNVIPRSNVSIITNIGLDHTQILGDTLAEIANDKLGIVRAGSPLLTAETRPDILDLFRQRTARLQATTECAGDIFRVENVFLRNDGVTFDYISNLHILRGLQMNMCGAYQAQNAALALRAVEIIALKNGTQLNESALRDGLRTTFIPARYERMQEDPIVILDGAHNPDKIEQLAAYLRSQFTGNSIIFVCGFTSGRNIDAMLRPLTDIAAVFYFTRVITGYRMTEEPRYLQETLQRLAPSIPAHIAIDPDEALESAIIQATREKLPVCVTGSLYLAGHLRQRWHPEYRELSW